MSKPPTLIIIPAFNEAANIRQVVRGVNESVPWADVVVIDDGSTDKTFDEAVASGAFVIRHPFNLGYGAALQTGYKYAWRNGYELVAQIDGDGQHDPASLLPLLARVESKEANLVVGTRFHADSGYRPTGLKRAGSAVFGAVARAVTRQRITDPTSGFQAMDRSVISVFQSDLFPHDYPDTDVLIMLHRLGFKLAEVPVKMRQRGAGRSMHSGAAPIYYVFKMFLSLLVTMLRKDTWGPN